jgi:hypothetical protein
MTLLEAGLSFCVRGIGERRKKKKKGEEDRRERVRGLESPARSILEHGSEHIDFRI